jgi:hypothetical protein
MLHRVALASSSDTSVLIRATQCNIPEGGILHSHRRENINSYRIACVSAPMAVLAVSATNKQTPWSLVRELTIPTDRPPLVGEIFSANFCGKRGVAWSVRQIPYGR